MKKTLLILLLSLLSSTLFGQDKEGAEKLVNEGIEFHDKGEFDKAVSKYNKALELDKNNLLALAEKAMTLLYQNKYEESIACCEAAIENHSGNQLLNSVYVTYGNAYDGLKKTDESIGVYDDGIKLFPDYYQLYFNKGVSLIHQKNYEESLECFQKAVQLNPNHASSHNGIARIVYGESKKVPAILAYCRFLSLEPTSKRAQENLSTLKELMKGSAEKTGNKSITITIDPGTMGDTTADGKNKANNFSTAEMLLSLESAMDFDKKYKKETEVEQFIRKFGTLCSILGESRKDNSGFFWEYYAPYFVEMKEQNLVEAFGYIAFASSDNAEVSKWLKDHKDEIGKFLDWSKGYSW
nr:tetratricopeptide repeat protein [uncultured Fluviicola sp.]